MTPWSNVELYAKHIRIRSLSIHTSVRPDIELRLLGQPVMVRVPVNVLKREAMNHGIQEQ
jgi:hypothetical protein